MSAAAVRRCASCGTVVARRPWVIVQRPELASVDYLCKRCWLTIVATAYAGLTREVYEEIVQGPPVEST